MRCPAEGKAEQVAKGVVVLGAVEAMKDRAAEAISKGLSAEEYRTAIIRAHRKA